MNIFITGIRGFLGRSLAHALKQRGHEVRGSASEPGTHPCLRLGRSFDPSIFGDVDTIVHAAHDVRTGSVDANLESARAILSATPDRHRIFISSHSARPDAVSEYGISKYQIESLFLEANETVVRPGLVIGNGGLFGRQLRAIRNSRVIPLVGGGRDAVPVLAISDFCAAMALVIERPRKAAFNLFNQSEPAMREVVETILRLDSRLDGRRVPILAVPYPLALAAVRAAEQFGIRTPVTSGSLRSMVLNRRRIHESNLRELLAHELPLEEAIARAIQDRSSDR